MIEFISGYLLEKTPNTTVIDTHGIGYKIFISLNTYNSLPELNQKITLMKVTLGLGLMVVIKI